MATLPKTLEAQQGVTYTLATLAAVGITDILKIDSGGQEKFDQITFTLTVTLNAVTTAVFRFLGGPSASELGILAADGLDRSITADGSYNFVYNGLKSMTFFAVRLVSEAAASDSSTVVKVKAG
ncbi:hypothetical protein LCGC14_1852360 [marine sediment metagenome]|uniref:Uncharacterized protein n=1 Tax=marine sediment metagenome TaxID=412755 RepID=A0A0F9GY67_9ZZZZ